MPSKRLSDPGICPMIGLAGWQNGWIYKSILNKTIYFIKTDLYYLCGKISLFLFLFLSKCISVSCDSLIQTHRHFHSSLLFFPSLPPSTLVSLVYISIVTHTHRIADISTLLSLSHSTLYLYLYLASLYFHSPPFSF